MSIREHTLPSGPRLHPVPNADTAAHSRSKNCGKTTDFPRFNSSSWPERGGPKLFRPATRQHTSAYVSIRERMLGREV
jgi:hypothetical protein